MTFCGFDHFELALIWASFRLVACLVRTVQEYLFEQSGLRIVVLHDLAVYLERIVPVSLFEQSGLCIVQRLVLAVCLLSIVQDYPFVWSDLHTVQRVLVFAKGENLIPSKSQEWKNGSTQLVFLRKFCSCYSQLNHEMPSDWIQQMSQAHRQSLFVQLSPHSMFLASRPALRLLVCGHPDRGLRTSAKLYRHFRYSCWLCFLNLFSISQLSLQNIENFTIAIFCTIFRN